MSEEGSIEIEHITILLEDVSQAAACRVPYMPTSPYSRGNVMLSRLVLMLFIEILGLVLCTSPSTGKNFKKYTCQYSIY